MLRFVLSRLFGAVIVLWIIVTISFFLMRFAPGSPFDADRRLPPAVEANKWIVFGMGREVQAPVAGEVTEVADVEAGRHYEEDRFLLTLTAPDGEAHRVTMPTGGKLVSFGVKEGARVEPGDRLAVVPKSLAAQYVSALGKYVRLDFGVTISSDGRETVLENLRRGLPVSLELGGWALLLALLLGVSSGLFAGLKQNTFGDYTVMSFAMVGISVPTIVSGPLLIALFAGGPTSLVSGIFDYGEWDSWDDRVLPVVTLGLVYTASFARLTRGGMLEVIRSDYIRTARAKGLPERTVVTRHAMKGAILPTVTYLGPAIARIVTGSIVVEEVFGLPGLADYFVTPALNRDYPMVIGVVVLYSALLVLMNLAVDLAYTALDPRVSYD
ncbi:MAG: ABC transporter permease [Myxococcota bacterium]